MKFYVYLTLIACFLHTVSGFDLTILHTNDFHARFEETNKYSGVCTDPDGKCYGGVARLKTKIDEIKSQHPNNTLVLDAGDQFQGTLWFSHFGGIISAVFMNQLGYDAMALGNHEFDRNIDGLVPFLKNASFPVLSCNIDASREPKLQGLIKTHKVVTVDGEKIGLIGYTTTATTIISNTGNLIFKDEIQSIKTIVQQLESQGVNKIIALGHSGFNVDQQIAAQVSGIDIIVGGHTNTFLYTGAAPSNDKPLGAYPTVVTQTSGDKVLVVQDYAYGKYLGVLNVVFDSMGKVTNYSGNPVLLNHEVSKDKDVVNLVKVYAKEIEQIKGNVLGHTLVRLEGERSVCRTRECNLGNIIADGVVHQNLRHADTVDALSVFIAIVNSGSIRASIEPGNITYAHAINVQPFRNTLERITLQGRYIREALEVSVQGYDTTTPPGGFLQVSGLRVWYDLNLPVGKRVVNVTVICSNCSVPEFLPLDDNQKYRLALSNFILNGGDNYDVIKKHAEQDVVIGDLDSDVFVEYIKEMSPIYQGLEGRIQFVDSKQQECTVGSGTLIWSNPFLILLTLCILIMIRTW